LGALPPGTAATDFSQGFFAVNQLAAVSLFAAHGDFLAKLGQTEALQLFSLFEKPQSLSHHFALRLIKSGLEEVGDEGLEHVA